MSGETKTFSTGAVRSSDADATAYTLLSPVGLRRAAQAAKEGEKKYSAYNWERGMELRELLEHTIRHCYLYLEGDRSEDHLGHAAWNAIGACHSEELWTELNKDTLRGPGCKPPQEKAVKRPKRTRK